MNRILITNYNNTKVQYCLVLYTHKELITSVACGNNIYLPITQTKNSWMSERSGQNPIT